jgi:metallo-beta-lactamase family protein
MAIRITQVFKEHAELFDSDMARLIREKASPFDFPGLKMTESTEESKSLNHMKGTKMIIAGAGMCNGGRIKHHLVNNISEPQNTVLFIGYQAVGTLGRSIVDGIKKVRILGQRYPVRARIAEIKGFSAHADRNELLEWISHVDPKRVFVIHGEAEAAKEFAEFLKEKKGWKVSVPMYGESALLD